MRSKVRWSLWIRLPPAFCSTRGEVFHSRSFSRSFASFSAGSFAWLIPYYKPNGKNMYFDVDELVSWQKKNHFEPAYSASEN